MFHVEMATSSPGHEATGIVAFAALRVGGKWVWGHWVLVGVLPQGAGWRGGCHHPLHVPPCARPPRGHLTLAYGNAETRSPAGTGAGDTMTRRVSTFCPSPGRLPAQPPACHLSHVASAHGRGEQTPAPRLSPHRTPFLSSSLQVPPHPGVSIAHPLQPPQGFG